jgi:LCP family protein required for cell wall assembly
VTPASDPKRGGPRRQGRRGGRRGGGRVWLIAVLGFLGAARAAGVVAVVANRQPGESVGRSVTTTVAQVLQGGKPENILIIGNNARGATTPRAPGQADLMVLAHIVPAQHRVTLISLPRDALVGYPGWYDPIPKLKSALLMGGAPFEVKEVSKFLGMPIQGYIEADFDGFAAAINAVGGVSVDIPGRLYDPIHSHANFEPGYQHLNGAEALAYIRIRQNAAGNGQRVNDFQRMDAAYQVLLALKHQVLARLSLSRISSLLGVLRTDFATNLPTSQLVGLLASADHASFHHVTVGNINDAMVVASTPVAGVNNEGAIEGADYDLVSQGQIAQAVAPLGGRHPSLGLPPLPAPRTVPVLVTDDAAGRALAATLRRAGFAVAYGAAVGGPSVTYPSGQFLAGFEVATQVGMEGTLVQPGSVSEVTVSLP